ncbi:MAG: chemotaxis protein CheW [Phycisphaerae bacterium]|nr:chemotaxis protein CheW [Phycisphaerae bacterium]
MVIDKKVQSEKRKQGLFLTFIFFEQDGSQNPSLPNVIGWKKLNRAANSAAHIMGYIELYGEKVEVIDIRQLYRTGQTHLTDESCIAVFEYLKPKKHFQVLLVDGLANVFNMAELDDKRAQIIEISTEDRKGEADYKIVFEEQSNNIKHSEPLPIVKTNFTVV